MNANVDQPIIRRIRVSQGESIELQGNGHAPREVMCDDIARLALAIHHYSYFFSRRRDLSIRFSRDINGSGVQLLEISRKGDKPNPLNLISILFGYTYSKDGQFLYEADLITDQRKDYEPTVNRGKQRFFARFADIQIDWDGAEAVQWRFDIDRLSKSPETLTAWIDAELEMLVSCVDGLRCGGSAVLTRSDLTRQLAAGLSLEDLKARLTCSKCGKRQARVFVF